jgi:hypothetical protein
MVIYRFPKHLQDMYLKYNKVFTLSIYKQYSRIQNIHEGLSMMFCCKTYDSSLKSVRISANIDDTFVNTHIYNPDASAL